MPQKTKIQFVNTLIIINFTTEKQLYKIWHTYLELQTIY